MPASTVSTLLAAVTKEYIDDHAFLVLLTRFALARSGFDRKGLGSAVGNQEDVNS